MTNTPAYARLAHMPSRRTFPAWVASACVLLTLPLIAVPATASDTGIEPVPAVTSSVEAFEPVSPIEGITGTDTQEKGSVRGPAGPRGPQAPSGPAGSTAAGPTAAGSLEEVTARIAQLSASLATTGVSDGVPPSPEDSQLLIDALRQGRSLSGVPGQGPQTSVDAQGCPTSAPAGTLREGAQDIGIAQLCADSVAQAATPEAAEAVKWTLRQLGAPYACGGAGRNDEFRFDCSSLVTRAYYEAAGLNTAGESWAPSTRDLMPWDGVKLAPWAQEVSPQEARPGDLILYRSCTTPPCSFQHVVMLLADGYMVHTNRCGDVAHVTKFTGFDPGSGFAVARRVDPQKARS